MNQIRMAARNKSVRSICTLARRRQLTPLNNASIPPFNSSIPVIQCSPLHSINQLLLNRHFSNNALDISDNEYASVYDDDWNEWFGGVEYQSASLGFDPLNNLKLDRSSRFLIQQLQDLYHGMVQRYDRPTTEQCNKILNDLLQHAVENNVPAEEYAFRADAILQCMQLFLNIAPSQPNTRLPYPLPLPNRDSYITVLTLYSKTRRLNAKHGPQRTLDIVESMQEQSKQLGDFDLQPIPHDYNKVLLAWGTCRSPKKSYYAANLLLKLKREDLADDLSYTHVLRACAFSQFESKEEFVSADFKVAQDLAAQVAIKVWGDMVKNNVKCNNATYSYFLKVCTFLDNESYRDFLVKEAFGKCRREGLVDDIILQRLKDAASLTLWKRIMGKEIANGTTLPKARDLRPEWTRNAWQQR